MQMEAASAADRQKMFAYITETLLGSGQYVHGPLLTQTAEAFEQKIFTEAGSSADYFNRINKRLDKIKALSVAPSAVAGPPVQPPEQSSAPIHEPEKAPAASMDRSAQASDQAGRADDIHVSVLHERCFILV